MQTETVCIYNELQSHIGTDFAPFRFFISFRYIMLCSYHKMIDEKTKATCIFRGQRFTNPPECGTILMVVVVICTERKMKMKFDKIKWMTRTAVLLAVLVLLQFVTKPLGQLVTGSAVNFVLIASVVLGGLASGIVVAAVSPFLAYALGIGPAFIQLIPFIALGNLLLVLVYGLVLKRSQTLAYWLIAVISATLLKFIVLYLGIVQLALPLISDIKAPQLTALSAMFSWPQLVTAAIGGVLAWILIPTLQRAIRAKER